MTSWKSLNLYATKIVDICIIIQLVTIERSHIFSVIETRTVWNTIFAVQSCKMREFGGYCIPSGEYRQMYELEAQKNSELRISDLKQGNIVASLQRQLEEARQQLCDNNTTVKHLQQQLEEQKKETGLWIEKFELQDLKTERAHQRRMDEEQKVCRLEKVAADLRAEMEKTNSVQVSELFS